MRLWLRLPSSIRHLGEGRTNQSFGGKHMTRDLKQRIAFTLGALLVWRAGVYLPVPGIDPELWAGILRSQPGNIFIWQQFNFLSGGAVRALGIFSLGIMPYVTATIILQLMTF